MTRKCQRRARKATFVVYTGHNDKEIAEFTMFSANTHNKCLLLRSSDGTLMGAMHVGDVALFGQDYRLQLFTGEDFESKYELLTD
jgi:hypothetical protein